MPGRDWTENHIVGLIKREGECWELLMISGNALMHFRSGCWAEQRWTMPPPVHWNAPGFGRIWLPAALSATTAACRISET